MVYSPINPRPDTLPLNGLEWDRFESFCTEFIAHLPEVKPWAVHRYGQQGDQQKGIDIIAEMENGEHWVFQCKKYKSFKASQAQSAVRKCTYQANKYVLALSCKASTEVRDEIQKHQDWDVWDVEDLSRIVKDLPPEVARRIVERHFGKVWRREFLGLTGLITFVSASNFFERWLKTDQPFNHKWQLVGRDTSLAQLHNFVKSESQIAFLYGRGGIGKTRLVYEFSKTFGTCNAAWVLRFWMEGTPINSESLDELPVTQTVVVIDNADRCDDLPVLLAFAQQHPQILKLIFIIRPGSLERLKTQTTHKGISLEVLEELKALDRSQVKELARQALGDEYCHWVDQLAAVTRDCPLVTVVGGWLLRKKNIAPALLERDQDFQNEVLSRLQENFLESIGNESARERCRELLKLISAVSPVYPNNPAFQEVASKFLKTTKSNLLHDLESLEESSILIRRGKSLRITPDVLSEHILTTACLTKEGIPTGYVQESFELFNKLCLKSILRNFSELDWRISATSKQKVDLLTEIWQKIWDEFRSASNSGRYQLLDLLGEMAVYQPKQALDLVEFTMQNPATVLDQTDFAAFYTHQKVLKKLPPLLYEISYTMSYLPRCCDLLWELVKQTSSEISTSEQSALQVLIHLAEYDVFPRKDLEYNHLVVEAAERWLKDPHAFSYQGSPLDVLDPVLARTYESTRTEGLTITMQEFYVNQEYTQVVRDKALHLIDGCIASEQPKIILRSLKSLDKALANPDTRFSQRADNQCEQWVPEQLKILDMISQLVGQTTNPLIQLEILQMMHEHAHHAYDGSVKQQMLAIINAIPVNDQLKLTGALICSSRLAWLIKPVEQPESNSDTSDESFESDWQRQCRLSKNICADAVHQLFQTFSDPREAVSEIRVRLDLAVNAGLQPEFDELIKTLGDLAKTDYLTGICSAIIQNPKYLAAYLGLLLSKLREEDIESAIALAQTAVDTENPSLCASIAQGFWGGAENLQPLDIDLIRKLAHSDYPGVKKQIFYTLQNISQLEPRLGTEIALTINVGESSELADSLCRFFDPNYGISPEELTHEQLEVILSKLENVADLDQCNICRFLSYACSRSARATINLLLARLRNYAKEETFYPFPRLGFRHNPNGGTVLSGLQDSQDYQDILSEVRDLMMSEELKATSCLPRLFKLISLDLNSVSLEVLNWWINSGDATKVKNASQLLQDASSLFVFKNNDFVANLLNQAASVGSECLKEVRHSLLHTLVFRSLSRTVGQPSPTVVDEREQAMKIADKHPLHSSVRNFYQEIAERAQNTIQEQVEMDEELLE
ncbi:MAG: restriction endonuclease [Leptolyngbyaceae cyanobacterium bins.302]|nr:restriction endonuclease [Leptolyngbyaceae cyanobacterium bins.302]